MKRLGNFAAVLFFISLQLLAMLLLEMAAVSATTVGAALGFVAARQVWIMIGALSERSLRAVPCSGSLPFQPGFTYSSFL